MRPQTQSSNIQGAGITSRQADVAESAGTVCGHQESRGHLWARTVRTTDVLLVCKCFRLLCSVSAQASPQRLVLNKVASHNEQPNRWWWGVCLFSWESSLKHLPVTFKCYFVCLFVCDRVSLPNSSCPETHGPSVSAVYVLNLQACTIRPRIVTHCFILVSGNKQIIPYWVSPPDLKYYF